MRTYRILVPVGFIALLVIVAVWAGHTGRVQDFLIERLARHRLHQTRTVFLGRDQITVVLCGTGVSNTVDRAPWSARSTGYRAKGKGWIREPILYSA